MPPRVEGDMGRSNRSDVFADRLRYQSVGRAVRTFGRGIERDYDTVRAALEYSWSNAQCEGQVTWLKLIKRQMFGRAKFALPGV